MAKTYISLDTHINTWRNEYNSLVNQIGDIANLSTGDKVGGDSDLVTAIAELDSDIGARPHTTLNTTAKNLTAAINELDSDIGANPHTTLNTSAKTLTAAINEHEADIGNMTFTGLDATNISAALRELRTELGDHTSLSTGAKSNLVLAINEIDSDVGDISTLNSSLITDTSNVVSAINTVASDLALLDSDNLVVNNRIGELSNLNDSIDNTANVVSAINETWDRIPNIYDSDGTLLNP